MVGLVVSQVMAVRAYNVLAASEADPNSRFRTACRRSSIADLLCGRQALVSRSRPHRPRKPARTPVKDGTADDTKGPIRRKRYMHVAGQRFPALSTANLFPPRPKPSKDLLRLSPQELRAQVDPFWSSGLVGACVEAGQALHRVESLVGLHPDRLRWTRRRLRQSLMLASARPYLAVNWREQQKEPDCRRDQARRRRQAQAIRELASVDRRAAGNAATAFEVDRRKRSRSYIKHVLDWYYLVVREILKQGTKLNTEERDPMVGELVHAVLGLSPSVEAVRQRYARAPSEMKRHPIPLDAVLGAVARSLRLPVPGDPE